MLALDGIRTRLRCGDHVTVECGPIKNPVTGAEAFQVLLPEGIIFKHGSLGTTTSFRVSKGIETITRAIHGG
jgi:hypothetical protein